MTPAEPSYIDNYFTIDGQKYDKLASGTYSTNVKTTTSASSQQACKFDTAAIHSSDKKGEYSDNYFTIEGRKYSRLDSATNTTTNDLKLKDNEVSVSTTDTSQQARKFDTGATRSSDENKPDYEGYLSPLVIQAFGAYMLKHQYGGTRASDNWKHGIPRKSYIKSMWRHFLDVWFHYSGHSNLARESLDDALCGLYFNLQGFFHEYLKEKGQ